MPSKMAGVGTGLATIIHGFYENVNGGRQRTVSDTGTVKELLDTIKSASDLIKKLSSSSNDKNLCPSPLPLNGSQISATQHLPNHVLSPMENENPNKKKWGHKEMNELIPEVWNPYKSLATYEVPRDFVCDICLREFRQRKMLHVHREHQHKEILASNESIQVKRKRNDEEDIKNEAQSNNPDFSEESGKQNITENRECTPQRSPCGGDDMIQASKRSRKLTYEYDTLATHKIKLVKFKTYTPASVSELTIYKPADLPFPPARGRCPPIRRDIIDIAALLSSRGGKGDPALKSLNLGGEFICDRGFELLAESLKKNVYLRELFLYNTNLGLHGMRALTKALIENRTLSHLNLGENLLCADSVELLLDLLRKSPGISQLYLDWGVTNPSVKKTIHNLLDPKSRLNLWLKKEGRIPKHALQRVGHHAGRFGKRGQKLFKLIRERRADISEGNMFITSE